MLHFRQADVTAPARPQRARSANAGAASQVYCVCFPVERRAYAARLSLHVAPDSSKQRALRMFDCGEQLLSCMMLQKGSLDQPAASIDAP